MIGLPRAKPFHHGQSDSNTDVNKRMRYFEAEA
jgi:hypothetical protein